MSSRTTHGSAEVEDSRSDWRIDLFSNAVEVNPTRSLVAGEEYPYVPMDALSTDSPKVAYLEKRTWNRSSGTRFQNGDVLFARITPSAENGKTALVDFLEEGGRGFGSTEFIVLSPRRGGIEDSRLLYYLVKFERIRNQAIQRMTGSTGRQRIPPEAFDDILCPIPPVNEQRKMASILCLVDNAIQKSDEIIAKTQHLKKGLRQQLLTKGIGHTKFKQTEIGQIPAEWRSTQVGSIASVTNGATPRRSVREYWEGGTVPWIPTAQVNERYITKPREYITEKALRESHLSIIPKESVLLAMIGQGLTRGKVAKLLLDATINQNFAAITPSKEVNSDFVFHYLDSNYARIRSLGRGGNQWALNCEIVKRIIVPVPSRSEQEQIVSVLRGIEEKLQNESLRRERLQTVKRGLMQTLLSGKERVKVD